jgi:hypothetical protein
LPSGRRSGPRVRRNRDRPFGRGAELLWANLAAERRVSTASDFELAAALDDQARSIPEIVLHI